MFVLLLSDRNFSRTAIVYVVVISIFIFVSLLESLGIQSKFESSVDIFLSMVGVYATTFWKYIFKAQKVE